MCRILACEDHQWLFSPFSCQVRHLVDKGHRIDCLHVHSPFNQAGRTVLATEIDEKATPLLQQASNHYWFDVLYASQCWHPVGAWWWHIRLADRLRCHIGGCATCTNWLCLVGHYICRMLRASMGRCSLRLCQAMNKLGAELHSQFIGCLARLFIRKRLHRQSKRLPASEAPGENCHSLLCWCSWPVPVCTLRRAVRAVLAEENDEGFVSPLPRKFGKTAQNRVCTNCWDMHCALDEPG